jgi:putative mRNA 3-end processing factor
MQYGESQNIQGVKFSFHPAGHIVGSAQIRVEYRGEIWVVSGDYKIQADNISDKFQPVKCHTFITESTFGLPIYQWPDPQSVFSEINTWWASNSSQGVTSILSAYALGKAQRVIQNVDHSIGPVFCHSATEDTNNIVRQAGVNLKSTRRLPERLTSDELSNALIIAPGGGNALWLKGIQDYSTAAASGWMILRGRKNWSPVDRRFVLSDHADWQGLITTIKETGCEQVIVTHGYTAVFSRWLRESGLRAAAENANYEGEDAE